MKNELLTQSTEETAQGRSGLSRRRFIGLTGGLVAAGMLLDACNKDDDRGPNVSGGINLGSGDTGVLNYAYALEQLEAAFYTQVVASGGFATAFSTSEQALLTDIRDHEVAHREFFKAALGNSAIRTIEASELNFSTIDFSNRTSVLQTAKAFEDLGVSAYNGAGQLLVSDQYLLLAGKIVSVEARHAAYVRDLIANGTFAASDVVDMNGLDMSRTPAQVLAIAQNYLKVTLNANNLPTS